MIVIFVAVGLVCSQFFFFLTPNSLSSLIKLTRSIPSPSDNAIRTLPLFSDAPDSVRRSVGDALDKMVQLSFPFKSDEYVAGSSKRREYLAALDALLYAMARSGDSNIVRVRLKKGVFWIVLFVV